jgi:hypothetical protein
MADSAEFPHTADAICRNVSLDCEPLDPSVIAPS